MGEGPQASPWGRCGPALPLARAPCSGFPGSYVLTQALLMVTQCVQGAGLKQLLF